MSEKVARFDEIEDGGALRVVLKNGREIAVFRRGEAIYAIDAQCPHQRGPLEDAALEDGFIAVCPWHGWRFDIRTGESPTHPAKVACHTAKVENGDVLIG